MYYSNNNDKSDDEKMCIGKMSDSINMYAFNSQKLLDERIKRSLEIFEDNKYQPYSDSAECSVIDNSRHYIYKNNNYSTSINLFSKVHDYDSNDIQCNENSQNSTYSISSINHHVTNNKLKSYHNVYTSSNSANILDNSTIAELKSRVEVLENQISNLQDSLFGSKIDIFERPKVMHRRLI